jgi:hypothetical protein
MSACRIHLRYYSNPIRFCVKTLSAHGSHFGWRSWSPDTILKVYYSRTMHAMFALKNNFPIGFYVKTMAADGGHFGPRSGLLNTILEVDHRWHVCYIGFRGEDFKTFFSHRVLCYKTMSTEGGLLGWRSGSPETILKIYPLRTIHAMFALNWLTGFREDF